MKIIYKATRKEITDKMNEALKQGFEVYRVRRECDCKTKIRHPTQNLQSNQRNAILIVQNNEIVKIFIKCKNCTIAQNKFVANS